MRRKDREMDKKFGLKVIDKSRFATLSMIDKDGKPYGLPLSIVRNGNTLYFHSAKEGAKVEALKSNPYVSISFVGDIKIPDNYREDQLDEIIKDESKTVLLISSVFTTEFESAIVKGKVELVQEENEKIKAMRLVCEKYTPQKMKYFNAAVKAGLARANVYRLVIDEITAKRKKYDSYGEEMKWGRIS